MRPETKTEKKEDNTMETMNVKDFYFDLPQELIAQDPLEDRSSSRLLVLDKNTGEMEHIPKECSLPPRSSLRRKITLLSISFTDTL